MVQFHAHLDRSFAALADATRRGVLEQLGRGEASISDLAALFDMTLTGMKKHVQILEEAQLVTTQKVGRTRRCLLGPHRLAAETAWMERHRQMLEERFDRLAAFLDSRADEALHDDDSNDDDDSSDCNDEGEQP